jgi:hypothetical protein
LFGKVEAAGVCHLSCRVSMAELAAGIKDSFLLERGSGWHEEDDRPLLALLSN